MWENYENGTRQPRYGNLQKIAQKFGFSLLWILDGREDQLTADQLRTVQLGEFRLSAGDGKRANKKPKSRKT